MISRRHFTQLSALSAGALLSRNKLLALPASDINLEIAPYTLEASPKHTSAPWPTTTRPPGAPSQPHIRAPASNHHVPGPLLRMPPGQPTPVTIRNHSPDPEILHW